jgi:hypothetical protein
VSKWLKPSTYFGVFFGSEGEVVPGVMGAVLVGSSSVVATLSGGEEVVVRGRWQQFMHALRLRRRKEEQEPTPELVIVPTKPVAETSPVSARKPVRLDISKWTRIEHPTVRLAPKPVQKLQPLTVSAVEDDARKKKQENAVRLLLLAS